MEKVVLPRGQTSCLTERQFMFHVCLKYSILSVPRLLGKG